MAHTILTKKEMGNVMWVHADLIWAYDNVKDIEAMKIFLEKNIEALRKICYNNEGRVSSADADIEPYPEELIDRIIKEGELNMTDENWIEKPTEEWTTIRINETVSKYLISRGQIGEDVNEIIKRELGID